VRRALRPETEEVKLRAFLSGFSSLPFDDRAAEQYGRLRAQLAAQGTPVGPNDLMIGAIAVANNLTLVTHNTREFSRIQGLMIEDWEAPIT
jgi:tRNA(fMet)-specific endonuclease VapC